MPTSSELALENTADAGHPAPRLASDRQDSRFRLALLPDFAEEHWPSMDLCAEAILKAWPHPEEVCNIRPPYRRCFSRVPLAGGTQSARNADRLLNRLVWYPGSVRRMVSRFDAFHVVDHSYGALVHALPGERTGVYLHDLDAFRCLVEPTRDPRPGWFRRLARHILKGVQKAAVVFHSTLAVREEILRFGLLEPCRLVHAPLGICPEFTLTPPATDVRSGRFPELRTKPYLLHVGSCIPRKRVDVLLEVFAAVRRRFPELLLMQAGGAWTDEQRRLIQRLGVGPFVRQVAGLSRAELADLYRGAKLVLIPSEAEGFGLPVIEALACGAIVVASDLPTLRESGGCATVYVPVADLAAWVQTVTDLLDDPGQAPSLELRLNHAARFSWSEHTRILRDAYRRLLGVA